MPNGNAKALEIDALIGHEPLAKHIATEYHRLKFARKDWETQRKEMRDFIYAIDTSTTAVHEADWQNTTTVPKLCAIRDMLHAHYMAALFPNSDFVIWEADRSVPELKPLARAIRAYMMTKIRDSGFKDVMSLLVYDWIDYGNAFCDVYYSTNGAYTGPKIKRIDPMDIVFDLTASSMDDTPKIIRDVYSMADMVRMANENAENEKFMEAVNKAKMTRETWARFQTDSESDYNSALIADGFGSLTNYYNSGMVEVLQFQGDIYAEGEYRARRRIYVIDRAYVLTDDEIPSFYGASTIRHIGWRCRQGNLMAMGPLDNIVGMQYRLDHLQNMKSDLMDLTIFPPLKVKGFVEDFEWGPMERIYVGDEGDVEIISPDVRALDANLEIDWLENKMEEIVGTPKRLAGIADSSRQTAFEIRTLDDNNAVLFTDKILAFEHFEEEILNLMMASARVNLKSADVARTTNKELGVEQFLEITPEIIQTSGKIRPIAARHFAERQQRVQNLNNFMNSAIGQDPSIRQHMSSNKIAELIEEWLGFSDYSVYSKFSGLEEQVESEQYFSQLQETAVDQAERELEDEAEMTPIAPSPSIPTGG